MGVRGRVGVTVGKFNPPHLGHLLLVRTAAQHVDELHVLLADRPDQTLPATDRATWLHADAPDNVVVHVTPDDLPQANEPWARRALDLLPHPPDLAFSSEPWGPGWAAAMGAEHVMVDVERTVHPTSGTALRADLATNFPQLVPAARRALALRIVAIGAESSGKTTIAEALAAALGTVWVPEHGRWYWEGRRHRSDQVWHSREFDLIAAAQARLIDDLAEASPDGLVIADTDALVTAVWHDRYVGGIRLDLLPAAPEMYLLCAPDFAWVQDGTRESAAHRLRMHEQIARLAHDSGARVVELTGDPATRLSTALDAIEPLRHRTPLV